MKFSALFPEAMQMPVWAAVRLNGWAIVAVVFSIISREVLRGHTVSGAVAVVAALSVLIPTALYVRSLAKWIGGLDEVQSRIQLEAWSLAAAGAIFLMLALDLLRTGGIVTHFHLGWEGVFVLMIGLWLAGCVSASRRYS